MRTNFNFHVLEGVYDGSHAGNPYGVDLFKFPKLRGFAAWLMWRTAYWGKQISFANQLLIPVYWFKSWVFGKMITHYFFLFRFVFSYISIKFRLILQVVTFQGFKCFLG